MKLILIILRSFLAHSEVSIVGEYVAFKPNRIAEGCFSCSHEAPSIEKIEFQTILNFLPKKIWGKKHGTIESLKFLPSFSVSDETCVDFIRHETLGFKVIVEPVEKIISKYLLIAKVSLYIPLRGQDKPKMMTSESRVTLPYGRTLVIGFPSILRGPDVDVARLERICPKSVLNKFLSTSADKKVLVLALTPVDSRKAF